VTRLRYSLVAVIIAYLAGASGYAVAQLSRGAEPANSWRGLALAALPPLVWLVRARAWRSWVSERPPLAYSVMSGLGLAVTLSQSWRFGPAAGWAHLWAGGAFVAWAAWVMWLRKL